MPAFTAVPTASAVCAVGAMPVFADVEPDTAHLDVSQIDRARTSRTKAVIVVHLYGYPADLPDTDLMVIEDAAQAHGAIRDHSQSAAVIYSFYPTKNLGGIGDGGAVVDRAVDQFAASSAPPPGARHDHRSTCTRTSRRTSVCRRSKPRGCAWRSRISTADNERRRTIARHYREAAPTLRWQASTPTTCITCCVARMSDRSAANDAARATSVSPPLSTIHWRSPISLPTATSSRRSCPEAEAWAAECLSVPCFPEITDAEVDLVSRARQGRAVTSDEPSDRAVTIGGVDSDVPVLQRCDDDRWSGRRRARCVGAARRRSSRSSSSTTDLPTDLGNVSTHGERLDRGCG